MSNMLIRLANNGRWSSMSTVSVGLIGMIVDKKKAEMDEILRMKKPVLFNHAAQHDRHDAHLRPIPNGPFNPSSQGLIALLQAICTAESAYNINDPFISSC